MGQFLLILVVLGVGFVLWRSFGQVPATRRPPTTPKRPSATELQRDPETGVYHPVEQERQKH
ncbi:MAG: hypothetical protein KIT43_16595 [Bauldia sp.]|nr:hypothetical protein [Bauldia sp.]MCW5719191.1 hypothetical protein [Bauldia sp.]